MGVRALNRGVVSVWAGAYNGYHGGILNCSATGPFHVDHANTLVGFGTEAPPQRCAVQPHNQSYATYCETSWTGREWWEASAVGSVEECCALCAAIEGQVHASPRACDA